MKWSNRWLGALPALALALGACERAAPTAATPKALTAPPIASASLTLTGHTGISQFTICSVGADASYAWASTAWQTAHYSGAASSGSASVSDGGATGDAAWAAGACKVVYQYPAIDEHASAAPQVTATWQAASGIRLDSIVRDSLIDHDLTRLCGGVPCFTGPTQTYKTLYNTGTVAGAVNNDAGEIAFFYFTKLPSLTLQKTADAASVLAGQGIGFTIQVNSTGPGTARNVTVTDALPTGAGISWSVSPANAACAIASGTLSCSFGDLAAGSSASVHISSPTTNESCKAYDNTASASATDVSAVTANASTTVQCPPNLSLLKTADAATVSAGSPIGFTLTASNAGPGVAKNVTVTDPLPSNSGLSWSMSPAVAGCSITSGTLSCSFGDLAAGASASVHVTSPTTTGSCGLVNNSGTAQADGALPAQSSAFTTVQCPAISLAKVADAAVVNAGSPIGFTMTVQSAGPGTAKNVTLTDNLPTGAGISWSVSPAVSGCSISSGVLTCNFGDLAASTTASVHVSSGTSYQSCAQYNNTASVTATGLSASASASTTVQCPSLKLAKTADAASVNAGQNIGFTMTVSNAGPGAASGVTLSDPLPTGTGISWSVSPANAACSISGGTLTCAFGTLPAGSSATVHVLGATTAGSCGKYTNTATAQAGNAPSVQASASEEVVCNACGTFTIGYWKNHAGFGPQADVVTPLLPVWLGTAGGTKSVKVTTASAAVTLLQMNGKPSNPVNKLYAQLLAAKLSIVTGVDGSAVASVIAQADAFLATHNDSSSLSKSEASTVNGWATTLDQYNNGIIGPGHCQ